MKLFHDDIRPAPEGWLWARTNAQAQSLLVWASGLTNDGIDEISLDHDLGLEHLDPLEGFNVFKSGDSPNGTGYDLVCWMIDNDLCPPVIQIHSMNAVGALRMATELNDHGFDVTINPIGRRKGG